MAVLDFQSIQWIGAAIFLAFQLSLCVLTSLMLIMGWTNAFYQGEPHTKRCSTGRRWEFSCGAHLLHWSFCGIGGLLSGGAQITCILMLPGMLAATYYHYAAGGPKATIPNALFMVVLAYFGFVPLPAVKPMQWTPAAIFLTCHSVLIFLAALTFLSGKTDAYYESNPHVKTIFDKTDDNLLGAEFATRTDYKRYSEISLGACLLGAGCCITAAVISGGAQDMCLLQIPPLMLTGYWHFTAEGGAGRNTAILTLVIIVALACFGLVR